MDWELYERYRATLLLVGVAVVSILLLAFQKTAPVKSLRILLVRCTLPPQRFLSSLKPPVPSSPEKSPVASGEEAPAGGTPSAEALTAEQRRVLQVLSEENTRLRSALELKRRRWSRSVAAHVVGRDPQRWFHEIVLDKGREDGIGVDNAVLAIMGDREGLVGRIIEASAHVSKAMLLQDPLSAVAVALSGEAGEDGVVEGTNSHDLILNYLDRSSHVKIGDWVLTSGLGKAYPPGIPVGWVQEIGLDPRQLFLQAKLRPAVKSNQLRAVLVLVE